LPLDILLTILFWTLYPIGCIITVTVGKVPDTPESLLFEEKMSYKRIISCSHCGTTGHNKAGCPVYKRYIERRREIDPDSYLVRRYDAQKAKKAASAKNRRCTYCGERGHNRAGCSRLKDAIESFRVINAKYRSAFVDKLVNHGFGPGSMIQAEDTVWLVTGIDWNRVNIANKGQMMMFIVDVADDQNRLSKGVLDNRYWSRTRLPRNVTGYEFGVDYNIVVRTNENRIRSTVPPEFLDGTLGLHKLFKNKKSDLYSMKDMYGAFTQEFDPEAFDLGIW